ncbi:hypothetical protein HanRHA438_Chr04g0170791 [Helianthus annuus]|nr:hypothetical protein HanRHA438_Chr04g0170791 [Helianthus annuus]
MVLLYPIRDTIPRIIFHSASYLVLVSHQARFSYSYFTTHLVLVLTKCASRFLISQHTWYLFSPSALLVFLYRYTLGTRSHQVCFLLSYHLLNIKISVTCISPPKL